MPGLEGKTLDHYQLQRLIGRGGMADVYEGYDLEKGRIVAIKVFKGSDDDLLRRFIREARLMSSLRNEHLLPIYGSGEAIVDGLPRYYIVMPLMRGGTLRARIRRAPLPLEEACQCLRDIADALDSIHRQGVIHRDIKSSNVLLDTVGKCYLADFGIARDVAESTQLTMTGNVLGTVDYVAPELFESGRRADDRSDLYSLGVLLFELVTGQLPFTAENQLAVVSMHMNLPPPLPSKLDPHISPQIDRVILRAMDKNPDLRYPTAAALADAFCHAVESRDSGSLAGHDHAGAESSELVVPMGGAQQIYLPPVPPLPSAPPVTPASAPPRRSRLGRAPQPFARPRLSSPPPEQPAPTPAPVQQKVSPPAARDSRYRRRRFWSVFIIAFITLALIIGISVYAVVAHPGSSNGPSGSPTQPSQSGFVPSVTSQAPTATPNLTATAQAQVNATATAQARATASAIARATAVVEAHATATAGVIQTATAGSPAYNDSLTDPSNPTTQNANWDVSSGKCAFSKKGYHVMDGTFPSLQGCRETGYTYRNAAIQVNVSLLSGNSGGLFFRLSTDTLGFYNGYLFEINSQGYYKISTITDGNVSPLQDWTFSSAVKQDYGATNTLQVIMQNNTYSFYINGVFVVRLSDSTYTSAGDVGFVATTNGTDADVVYTDLSVYTPS